MICMWTVTEVTLFTMGNFLPICSFNSHGSGPGRLEYLSKLYKKSDLILVQEHWLAENQFGKFKEKLNSCNSHLWGMCYYLEKYNQSVSHSHN